jgi:hypothetical protein
VWIGKGYEKLHIIMKYNATTATAEHKKKNLVRGDCQKMEVSKSTVLVSARE